MKLFFTALLLVTLVSAQASEESIRSAIQYQINQRHPALPSGFWESLGSDAAPVIKNMYIESSNANEKSFLIDGLSHFKDSGTGSFLESEVTSTKNEVLKKKLLTAVIQSIGESAFEFVEPYLKDADGHIRLSVARGLMPFENEKIQRRLAEFKANEKSTWILADLNKKDSTETTQKTRKQIESVPLKNTLVTKSAVEVAKVIPPLTEKNWAGIWRGSYVTESKMIFVEANLVLVDASTVPLKWKIEFKLPKQVKQEWKNDEFKLNYFQTNHAHWIEIRNAKMDIVFVAQRKVN